MTEKYTYDSLSKLDEKKTSIIYPTKVRVILKEFLFTKLENSTIFKAEDLEKVRHSIINFLYCGKFTLKCENPIIYNDISQKELAKVSSIGNQIRLTNSKIDIIKESLIEKPEDDELKLELGKLEEEKIKLENVLKQEGDLMLGIMELQKQFCRISKQEASTENKKKLKALKNNIIKQSQLIKDSPEMFFSKIKKSWEHVTETYDMYIAALNIELNKGYKIDKIIVYEAPPYLGHKEVNETYFLTSKDPTYSGPIRECFDSEKEKEKLNMIKFLANYKIGFFDLSMACLPLSDGNIRKKWNRNPEFKFGHKQLTVILFELSLEHFIQKIGFKIVKHPLFAIGTPVNTSAGIFEHYSRNLLKVYMDKETRNIYFDTKNSASDIDTLFVDLGVTNTTSTFMKRDAKGTTFPLFKSNIISTAYPNAELMRNAFNIDN